MFPMTSRRRWRRTTGWSPAARRRERPILERLEDRTLLDAVTWTGADAPANPRWSDANNWSPHIPGAGDDVDFTGVVDGQTVPASSLDDFGSTIHSLTVDSSYGNGSGVITIPGNGALTITGGLSFSGGTIGGPGFITLTIGSVSNIASGTIVVGRGGWVNSGTLTLGPSAGEPAMGAGAVTIQGNTSFGRGTFTNNGTIIQTSSIVNGPVNCSMLNAFGAAYEIEGDVNVGNAAGPITNRGTLVKAAGSGTSTVGSSFVNDGGTIAAVSGTLVLSTSASFAPSSTFVNTSTFQPGPGATIDIAGSGKAIIDGTLTGSGGGQVIADGANSPTLLVGDATHAGGVLNFPAGMFRLIGRPSGSLDVVGGTTGAAAVLSNTGSIMFDTTAGTIAVGPEAAGGPLTVDNQGTITETGSTGLVLGQGNIVNESGGLYDIQSDGTVATGSSTLTNHGTFEKSAGSGTATVGTGLVNDGGTLVSQAGTLALSSASDSGSTVTFRGTSTFEPTAGTVIDFGAGTAVLTGTLTGSGTGQVIAKQGDLEVGDATFPQAQLAFPDGMLRWIGSGASSPDISGNLPDRAAVLTNVGFIAFDTTTGGFTVGAAGGPITLYNQGTIAQTGAGGVELDQGNIVNQSGAVYDIQSDGPVTTGGSGPEGVLANMGMLRKSAGTGTSTIQTFSNQGTVEVRSGTLGITTDPTNLSGNALLGGTWEIFAPAALLFESGDNLTLNDGNIVLSGAGARFANISNLATNDGSLMLASGRDFATTGSLTNNGTLTVGPATTLVVAGNYSQTAAATLDLQLGGAPTTGQFGQLTIDGSANLDGTLEADLVGGYSPGVADSFTVARYATHTGNFAHAGLPLLDGFAYQADAGDGELRLDPPVLISLSDIPANRTVEATGPEGAVVTFANPLVSDRIDPNPTLTVSPASGSTFPIGTTTVVVSASDLEGSSASASFTISVQDTTPPVIANVPSDLTVAATGPAGAVVAFESPEVTDLVDPSPTVTVTPASGTVFPIGTTMVTITAADHSYNSASATFTVDVQAQPISPSPTPAPPSEPAPSPTPTLTPAVPTPMAILPAVMGIVPVVTRRGMTALSVRFNVSLISASATDRGIYRVFASVVKQGKPHFTRRVAIKSITPSNDATMVTIRLAKHLRGSVQLTVHGTLTATDGASAQIATATIVRKGSR
jgi:hypothetical protein